MDVVLGLECADRIASATAGAVRRPHLLPSRRTLSFPIVLLLFAGSANAQVRRPTSDFNGDEQNDLVLYRAGTWLIQDSPSVTWGAASDVPVPGDYIGDGVTDIAVYRPGNDTWYIRNQGTIVWGVPPPARPAPADYDGDGRTDPAVFDPRSGKWYIAGFSEVVEFGGPGDIPVPADYNGDGRADLAVFRPSDGLFYVHNLIGGVGTGLRGAVPVPADYDGDGRFDLAIFVPSTGAWWFRLSSTGQVTGLAWGGLGDLALGLDVDSDGRAELAIFRRAEATWYIRDPFAPEGLVVFQGQAGDVPAFVPPWIATTVRGDMDGDRLADPASFSPATAEWHMVFSSSGAKVTLQAGQPGDIPVPGDYLGIGRNQLARYEPASGVWRIAAEFEFFPIIWGWVGDQPVPADYDGDGRTDVAVWRPSTAPGDIPVAADYSGDGIADIAVYRKTSTGGVWFISPTSPGPSAMTAWGGGSDVPVPGDYDGDGRVDIAVWRPATGEWLPSLGGPDMTWGVMGDTPVTADYNGDGKIDVSVFRDSSATWWVRGFYSNLQLGASGDIPLPRRP